MNYIRTKLRFSLLRSVLVAIYGVRSKQDMKHRESCLSDLDFGLIPNEQTFECMYMYIIDFTSLSFFSFIILLNIDNY